MSSRRTLLGILVALSASAQSDWPSFGRDAGAARYSPLKQINPQNIQRLERAWTFHTGKPGSEAIPIVVNGVMYTAAANGVFAIEPETGKQIWHFPGEKVALRGVAWWPGGAGLHPRVFVGIDGAIVAIDAVTGKLAPGFANEGKLDLRKGVDEGLNGDVRISLQSPPVLFKNILISGCSNGEGSPSTGAYGDIRGWDARTGKLLWTFHTVPRPGEPGYETWPADAWKNRSGTNAWGFLTIDAQRGIVYVPLGSPTSDFYGADRHGDNLYGNSLVALDAETGKLKWYQQLVHHDLWDYDPAAAPVLFDSVRGGRVVPAVAQITKQGLMFAFDRVSGEPLWGIEERRVAQSVIPGESTSPTQPFPVKPPPLARIEFTEADMYDRTPEHAAFCRELFEQNKMTIAAPFTPLGLEGNTLLFPSTLGGGGWGGISHDPSLGLLFTNVNNLGQWGHMEKKIDPATGSETYVRTSAYGAYARFWNRQTRVPCSNPPFGELVAVNTSTGDIAWRTPLGVVQELEAKGVKNTGTLNLGGSIATAGGLVFIAATNDDRFRAFESKTGRMVWERPIDGSGYTIPITYRGKDGRQYVAVMAGGGGGYFGGNASDSIIAFALGGGEDAASVPATTSGRSDSPPPRSLPAGPSKALVQRSCGAPCHTIDTVVGARRDRDAWTAVVDNMIARGARITPADAKAIIEYLTANYGK